MKLRDYANERENVVLFWAGIGCPIGDYVPYSHRDCCEHAAGQWGDLAGEMNADGDWLWSGDGDPRDGNRNSVHKLHAYESAEQYARLAAEWDGE